MKFFFSSETDLSVGDNYTAASRWVESAINALVGDTSLSSLDLLLSYVPIVMPPDVAIRYPMRSRAQLKNRRYLCAPQLDYPPFLDGTLIAQISECVAGLRGALTRLGDFGVSAEQVTAFADLLDRAEAQAISDATGAI